MNTTLLIVMLFVSLLIGLMGLIVFLWGLKTGQFDDEKKMTQSIVLFDGTEELNQAIQREKKQQNFRKE
ncbi:cbb3-type cytochrome oxidase assembly protein CcoS [Helicobacter sp. faydin-H20]|uniref:cbb3-type cytochrome oxidase assembly protein CcoS n=1 Tax=Helicobacter anatolicus TaxID=2905874 RepID=UPI001E54F515|nr:cbb3-type cytochrome oxidase assembly protein CcoS [Helicobacter anatolicus]MCE3037010.1 cbb3-type cytochrome oxidase assembly protein CcoS [Helicobacter anatolicus]